MNTATITMSKSTGLTKTAQPVHELANRLERARQSRNAKIERADAEYVEAVRRALSVVEETAADDKAPAAAAADTAIAKAEGQAAPAL